MSKRRGRPGKKAVVRTECLEKLKSGSTVAELLRDYSPGAVYDALKEYLPFLGGEVGEIRRQRESELQELSRVRDERKGVADDLAAKRSELDGVTRRLLEAGEKAKAEEDKLFELRGHVVDLDSRLKTYSDRGVTDEAYRRLDRLNFGKGDELLDRLDTAERFSILKAEVENLAGEKLRLEAENSGLTLQSTALSSEVKKLKIARDQEMAKNYVQSQSIRILKSFYDDGYSTNDIEGIRIGLNSIGIAGNPTQSVKDLVKILSDELKLETLRVEIEAKKAELKEIHDSIDVDRSRLAAIRDGTTSAVEDIKNITTSKIQKVTDDAVAAIKTAGVESTDRLTTIFHTTIEAGKKATIAEFQNLTYLTEKANEEIAKSSSAVVDAVRDAVKSEFEPYRKAMKVYPQLESWTDYGFLLLNLPNASDKAYLIPPAFVASVAHSIDTWIRKMMPDATTKAPSDLSIVFAVGAISNSASLWAISSWLRDELWAKIRNL